MEDYGVELDEIARWSEWWGAVFDLKILTSRQQQAVQALIWMSWKVWSWDIEYWEFILRVIVNTKWKYVTVLKIMKIALESDIY